MTVTSPAPATTPLLGTRYRAATAGSVALIFVAAFESLAVATVMPTVAADLGGERWYALAFSATVAAGAGRRRPGRARRRRRSARRSRR